MKIYVCNIMTQEGETEEMTAGDHVAALLAHGAPRLVELCLLNDAPIRDSLLVRYEAENARPIEIDAERIQRLGVEPVLRDLVDEDAGYARHDTEKLANAIMELYQERAQTKIF